MATVRDDRPLLTIVQAAARLGLHPQSLRSMVHRGQVPVVRLPSGRALGGLSNRMRFRPADIDRVIDASVERDR